MNEGAQMQNDVLMSLLRRASDTEYGRNHIFNMTKSYEDFANNVPVNTYEELKGDIDRMRHGEKDVLWPGTVKWYAKSSGTTNDKSKFIPVSADGLKRIHYQGGNDAVAMYLQNNPKSRLFDGRSLILGGSHSPNYNVAGSLVGDLSAILIENINPLVNLVRVPDKKTALISDFEVKRDRIAHLCLDKDVTNISGVPSWMMSVLMRVMELSGKQHLEEVWPNLEVFFHGGIAFTPYRSQYEQLITSPKMHYMETYNASEGFFGLQNDPNDKSMLLMLDYDVFYEFLPMDEFGKENPNIVPLEGVEIGRTKHFINAFGEELIVDNAEKGLKFACQKCNAQVLEYTAAPVFRSEGVVPHHQWVIEFSKEPEDLDEFADALDSKLQELNSDYEAKRYKDINMVCLKIVKARQGLFEQWMKSRGKLGGQNKVPRLSNSRDYVESLIEMNKE